MRSILDSDDDSNPDEDTPPSTPYGGDFFDTLPTYEDSMENTPLENSEIRRKSDHEMMEDYLNMSHAIADDTQGNQGYMEIHPPNTVSGRSSSATTDDEE